MIREHLGPRDLALLVESSAQLPDSLPAPPFAEMYDPFFGWAVPEPANNGLNPASNDDDDEGQYYIPMSGKKAYVNLDPAVARHAGKWKSKLVFDYFKTKEVALFTAWDRNGVPLHHRLAEVWFRERRVLDGTLILLTVSGCQ